MTILFQSSVIFDNPSFIDEIHQSFIDLKIKKTSESEVNDLLPKLLSYLHGDLRCNEIEEIFSLVSLIISQYPNRTKEFYNELLKNSQSNVNLLIITISIFSDFLDSDFCLSVPSFGNFLEKVKIDVYNFIEDINNDKKLIVLNQEINQKYEVCLIIDVFCMSKINEKETEIVSNCVLQYQYIPESKLKKFIQKITRANLLTAIPERFLINENILIKLSMQDFVEIIPIISDQIFIQIEPHIEKAFINIDWSQEFSVAILNKCTELDLMSWVSQNALNFISITDLTFSSIEYLCKYNIVLPDNIAENIMDFPKPGMLLKIMPYYENIPQKVLQNGLYEICDIKTYERILQSIKEFGDVFANQNFWIHVLFVISESEEKCSSNFLNLMANRFQKFISIEKFNTVFNEMIFNHFPTNNKENEFLCDLLRKLDSKYRLKFREMQDEIIIKIIDLNILPYPSFWKLFSFSKIKGFFDNNDPDPVLLYAYKFSSHIKTSSFFKTLQIHINLNASNQSLIKEFLKQKNIDFLKEMNHECLSLIMAALFLPENGKTYDIIGLEKETILPYFAIIFIGLNKDNKNLSNLSNGLINLLILACKDLPKNGSDLDLVSIDIILSNYKLFFNSQYFPIHAACKVIDILINQIFSDCYKSDKLIFFEAIFNLSNQSFPDEKIRDFFNYHGTNFFNYIIHNYKKYEGFDRLMNIGLNLRIFNDEQLFNIINQIINNDSFSEEIIDAVYFIENFCFNIPNFHPLDSNNLQRIIQTFIDNKRIDEVALLNAFLNNNDIKINFDITVCKILLYIIYDKCPESNDILFEFLFQTLMKNKDIAINYLIILFEKIDENIISPRMFLELYSNQYLQYDDCFINAIRHAFTFDSMGNAFIRKADLQNYPNSLSKIGSKIVSTFISKITKEPYKFQNFVCLKNIAASFPFLFNYNTHDIFNTILLSLDYFYLFFSMVNNEEEMNQLKSALSALSFLHSILFSTKILDDFLPWLFINITSFSISQIIAFSYILLVLFETYDINYIVLALAMKYKFMKSVSKLLEKNVPNFEMSRYYKGNIYKLITIYYKLLNEISYNELLIYVDEIQNLKNPFQTHYENYITIFPNELKQISLPFISKRTIQSIFYDKISEIKSFWIMFKFTNKPQHISLKKFLAHYQRLESNIPAAVFHLDLPSTPNVQNIKMIRYLSTQKLWIYNWFVYDNHFKILPEHKKILTDVINKMRNIEEISFDCNDEEIKIFYGDIDVAVYFLSEFCQKELFSSLINELSLNINLLYIGLRAAINAITSQKVAMFMFLDILNSFLKNKSNDMMSIDNFLVIFHNSKIFESYAFKNAFVSVCGDSLIDIALSPGNRNEPTALLQISELLCLSTSKLPIRATHLIAFMLFHDQADLISQAMELCEKVGEENLSNIKNVILNVIEKQFTKTILSFDLISCFFRKIPSFIKKYSNTLPTLLNKLIFRYKKKKEKDENLLNMIFMLFNWLAPKRNTDQMIIPEDEIDFSFSSTSKDLKEKLNNSKSLIIPAPSNLKETNQSFWMLYNKHRLFLNNLLSQDKQNISKLTFLHDFPELIRFQVRLDYFKEKMKKRIDRKNHLHINVKRSKILKASFDQLHQITNEEWFNNIRVSFENENGLDAGGLRAEWFTLIVKELFDPNNLLFISSQDKSYQPNALSNKKKNHLEYFKFAGKIIARAIIQGQCVNAHLMRSFCRQILHRQVKLKDLEEYDEKVFTNLQQILTTDVEPLMLDFTIRDESNQTVFLKENGDEIDLTNDNKKEYVSLFVNYRLRKSIIEQVTAFCNGFNSLIPHDDIKIFTPGELDLLICGIPDIDISDLKRNSKFYYPYSSDHRVIKMFFNVISTWDKENLGKFLLFLTGSSRVPVNGFKEYKDQGKPISFNPVCDRKRLCVAHTCFNTLDLPEYEDEEELNNKLLLSIQEYEFGLI